MNSKSDIISKSSEILAYLDFANQENQFPEIQMEDYYNAGIKSEKGTPKLNY